eukprot:CAMPEP_0204918496 /NCGR_PEP_ID=MMETSP1397-20131031/16193_1 /ASSEMBLY_ACC=CAM_ASM_000891 /TAXON_ID=49980 /ORGANISM="Climacostomum Climacostomum virens, Strain Stock W-24" /LENGTH=303 /DNA_ID=CAMNT_0052091807 /DNA_START=180 /DNA_END=1091 /DNA_ORIENTATION=-
MDPNYSQASTDAALQQSKDAQPCQISDVFSIGGSSPTDSASQYSKNSSLCETRNSRFKSLQFESSVSFRKASRLTFSPDAKISGRGHNRNDTLTSIDLSKVSKPMSYAETKNETERLNLNTKLIEAEEKRLLWNSKRFERQQLLELERKQEMEDAEYRHKFLVRLKQAEYEKKLKEREEAKKFNEEKHSERKETKQKAQVDAKAQMLDDLNRSQQRVKQNLKYRQEIKKKLEEERNEQRQLFIEKVQTQKDQKAAEEAILRHDIMCEATLKAETDLVLALRKNQEAISRLMTYRSVTSREGSS